MKIMLSTSFSLLLASNLSALNPHAVKAAPPLMIIGILASAALGAFHGQKLSSDEPFDANNPASQDVEKILEHNKKTQEK